MREDVDREGSSRSPPLIGIPRIRRRGRVERSLRSVRGIPLGGVILVLALYAIY